MASTEIPSGERRVSRWLIAAAIAAVLFALAATVPSPFAIERPGPVVDAFGTIEAESGGEVPVVSIRGAETFDTDGSLNVLSVTIRGSRDRPLAWLSLLEALFDDKQEIVPLDVLFPEGVDDERRAAVNQALMRSSQLNATAAALSGLDIGFERSLSVASVAENGPADGILREGDGLRSVDGAVVSTIDELRGAVSAASDGRPLALGIERDGDPLSLSVTPRAPDGGGDPLLGITVAAEFEFPFDVELRLDRIGGPSAGLIFALAITDLLTPGELTGGLDVSGTGTIDDAGRVGAIGGLAQKMWGAAAAGTDLFLMPLENCAQLPDSIPGGLVVAPVATLQEAIAAIETAASGGAPPGIERCDAG